MIIYDLIVGFSLGIILIVLLIFFVFKTNITTGASKENKKRTELFVPLSEYFDRGIFDDSDDMRKCSRIPNVRLLYIEHEMGVSL